MTALAVSRGVPFTPHLRISDDELVTLLNRASAMVYAPRLEPFDLAPIEAAACGLPVVAVAEGGVRETVIDNETGFLVQNAPRDVADAVTQGSMQTCGVCSGFGRFWAHGRRVSRCRRWFGE